MTGGRGETWSTAHKRPKSKKAPKSKVQSITDANFPVHCSNRRSAGPSEKAATPATECEVELLKGRRIISNELETKRRARENIGNENVRREGERETFTKAPSTGLVKETIPAGAEKVNVRVLRESGREDNAQIPVLVDLGQGNASKVNAAVRAAAQRTENHCGGLGGADTKGDAPANTPGTHTSRAISRSA